MRSFSTTTKIQRLCFPFVQLRLFSSTATHMKKAGVAITSTAHEPVTPQPISRRRQFQQIPVNAKLLQYIREQQVCRSVRQNRSRKMDRYIGGTTRTPAHMVQQQRSNQQEQVSKQRPPEPFGPKANPVRICHRIQVTDQDISGKIRKLNPKNFPTVAFCGRSNVGKSTLLNALLYGNRSAPSKEEEMQKRRRNKPIPLPRGAKATTSPTPGETKDITFYELSSSGGKEDTASKRVLWLADLPGYGFAQAPPELLAGYRELMATYLCHKRRPQRVLFLLDARHGMKQTDRAFLEDLQKRGNYQLPALQIVLTKCDLVEATDLARRVTQVKQDLDDTLRRQPSRLPVLLTSATRRNGILAIQGELASLVKQ